MANYIINECLTNDEYIVSAVTLTVGATIRFVFDETSFCGTVGEVTSSPISADFGQLYEDCCACLSGITESLNFSFIRCNDLEVFNIAATNFCREYGAPTTGITYEIQFGSETPFCATFDELSLTGETNYHYSSGPFLDCEDCKEGPFIPPLSSNTESTICQEICDNSVITIIPLHPIYINSAGQEVLQMNAVLIGGNGLNG